MYKLFICSHCGVIRGVEFEHSKPVCGLTYFGGVCAGRMKVISGLREVAVESGDGGYNIEIHVQAI